MTTSVEESDWAARVASLIADEVKRLRKVRGMSAQQLSEKCENLGLPIARSVIANLESKRRLTVSVPEVIILARALEVPPVSLIFPIGQAEKTEMLPGLYVDPMGAVGYLSGSSVPPGIDVNEYGGHQLFLYRKHARKVSYVEELAGRLRAARQEFARVSTRFGKIQEEGVLLQAETTEMELRGSALLAGLDEAELKGWGADAIGALGADLRTVSARLEVLRANRMDLEDRKSQLEYARWLVDSNLENLREQCRTLLSVRKEIKGLGVLLPDLPEVVEEAMREVEDVEPREFLPMGDEVVEPAKIAESGG